MGNMHVVYARDRERCHLCGCHVMRSEASLDHLIPRSQGGNMVPENLALAHKPCNHARGAMPLAVARAAIDALAVDPQMLDWKRRELVVIALYAASKVWSKANVLQPSAYGAKAQPFREQSRPWSPPNEKLRRRVEWDQGKQEWVEAPEFGEPTITPWQDGIRGSSYALA